MLILKTERLILRTFADADVVTMLAINQDPNVMRYFPSVQDETQTKDLIQKIQQHFDDKGYSLYAAELKSTQEFIGFVGLLTVGFDAHFTPAVEIGWRLAAAHWCQGYATEAAQQVLDYALNGLGLSNIVSFTAEQNTPSRRVMQKIGLRHNPADDFYHPNLDVAHPLARHVLYRLPV